MKDSTLRYAKQPRVGEALHFSDEEEWPITAVRERGLVIDAIDRVNRKRTLTRAPQGWWRVRRKEAA